MLAIPGQDSRGWRDADIDTELGSFPQLLAEIGPVDALQEKNDKLIEDIRNLFGEMDKRGTGKLTYDEYMEAVEANDVIKTKFVTLEIDRAEELWNLIDVGTGEIAVNQFAQGRAWFLCPMTWG